MLYKGLIEKYRKYIPVNEKTSVITLHEGDTPLIPTRNLPKEIGFPRDKYESLNPTDSFNDRGMTMAVSKAVEEGSKAVICASTVNTLVSLFARFLKYTRKSYFKNQKYKKIVCILTGHRLKDLDNAIKLAVKPTQVKADMKEIINAIGI